MYKNLEAELVRNDITHKKLASDLMIAEKTLSLKINGKAKFDVEEMWFIKNKYFNDLELSYLFEPKDPDWLLRRFYKCEETKEE